MPDPQGAGLSVCHLSASASPSDGGIATAVAALVAAQRSAGLAADWLTADRHPPGLGGPRLRGELACLSPALVHVHGLWRVPTRILPALAAVDTPSLVAPHGMLDPWALARSGWKKRPVWRLWERRALEAAVCLHALCPAEAEAIRALGLPNPIAVIPNGVTLPDRTAPLPAPPWAAQLPPEAKVLLFLGRFHPKKGTVPLLKAWSRIAAAARRAGWWLVLVGYGDAGALAASVAAEGIERCLVLGPCFGTEKESCYANAAAFVLPSFSEGLPMAVLEAMAWRLPCLITPACHLPEAIAAGAALAITARAEALEAELLAFLALSGTERKALGEQGFALVRERYCWPRVTQACAGLYRWLAGSAPPPASLR